MLILRAVGPHQRYGGKAWNWCKPNEPVGYHNMVCCNSATCGCNRSFVGIRSAKSTTHAVVQEVSRETYVELRDTLESCCARAWNSAKIGKGAVILFDELSYRLNAFSIGDILSVHLGDTYRLTHSAL